MDVKPGFASQMKMFKRMDRREKQLVRPASLCIRRLFSLCIWFALTQHGVLQVERTDFIEALSDDDDPMVVAWIMTTLSSAVEHSAAGSQTRRGSAAARTAAPLIRSRRR